LHIVLLGGLLTLCSEVGGFLVLGRLNTKFFVVLFELGAFVGEEFEVNLEVEVLTVFEGQLFVFGL